MLKFLYEKAEAKFPGTGNKAVGNLVYLRLITPNLVQPKNHLTKGKGGLEEIRGRVSMVCWRKEIDDKEDEGEVL